ncbi:hypothetical protein M2266_004380 [Streptomyces sp. SPB162]|nr:hypothetical protein [Streptomyces sp. SPB162]
MGPLGDLGGDIGRAGRVHRAVPPDLEEAAVIALSGGAVELFEGAALERPQDVLVPDQDGAVGADPERARPGEVESGGGSRRGHGAARSAGRPGGPGQHGHGPVQGHPLHLAGVAEYQGAVRQRDHAGRTGAGPGNPRDCRHRPIGLEPDRLVTENVDAPVRAGRHAARDGDSAETVERHVPQGGIAAALREVQDRGGLARRGRGPLVVGPATATAPTGAGRADESGHGEPGQPPAWFHSGAPFRGAFRGMGRELGEGERVETPYGRPLAVSWS